MLSCRDMKVCFGVYNAFPMKNLPVIFSGIYRCRCCAPSRCRDGDGMGEGDYKKQYPNSRLNHTELDSTMTCASPSLRSPQSRDPIDSALRYLHLPRS
jgi:hypothetical protein